jgi:hypothetical protein
MSTGFVALLPLVGVILGWGLKSITDYLIQRKVDVRQYRAATFYLLRAYKSLMDYERGTQATASVLAFRRRLPMSQEKQPHRV